MTKVILISQVPLPFSQIGSWTTLYKNYLQDKHQIDFIVCEPPKKQFENIEYSLVANNLIFKIRRKIKKNWYLGYLEALDKILKPNEKYVIQIVDNFGIVKPLHELLIRRGVRKNCQLQFFYHGFPPFYENYQGRWFFESIDEMVLLTNDSYLAHKNYYSILPVRFSVLHNGIDTKKFTKVLDTEKCKLKEELGFDDKKIFIWCSQDRPKKGLNLILAVWKKIYATHKNITLLVIGCDPREKIDGVQFLGRIPNDELPKYYQVSDCYLFPTLCKEGFGLSLIEALHCGNYCIASAMGGVPEVLQYGKLGKLIENPHFVSEWENAINDFLEGKYQIPEIPEALYSKEKWNDEMNQIIENAKSRLE
ncbi:glycosyltransferase family 4 protein [Flavobacterium aestivum]|uniref:glycosyltransferase family 4 protein n=1 Tax=Flavobacterium aestivum TaxID=3003257 RepID=UPI002482CF55|nr:glycosyltransferase family 4 protein [Flavobacterium aestivum]